MSATLYHEIQATTLQVLYHLGSDVTVASIRRRPPLPQVLLASGSEKTFFNRPYFQRSGGCLQVASLPRRFDFWPFRACYFSGLLPHAQLQWGYSSQPHPQGAVRVKRIPFQGYIRGYLIQHFQFILWRSQKSHTEIMTKNLVLKQRKNTRMIL